MNILQIIFPKYTWDFYEPVGFNGKKWVSSQYLGAVDAQKLATSKGWLYEIRLGGVTNNREV